jgi:hypothetical protein
MVELNYNRPIAFILTTEPVTFSSLPRISLFKLSSFSVLFHANYITSQKPKLLDSFFFITISLSLTESCSVSEYGYVVIAWNSLTVLHSNKPGSMQNKFGDLCYCRFCEFGFSLSYDLILTASVVQWLESLPTDPEGSGSIPGTTRFSEK